MNKLWKDTFALYDWKCRNCETNKWFPKQTDPNSANVPCEICEMTPLLYSEIEHLASAHDKDLYEKKIQETV